MNWPPQSPELNSESLEDVLESTLQSCSIIVNTRSQPKMNATLDGNKCCDVA